MNPGEPQSSLPQSAERAERPVAVSPSRRLADSPSPGAWFTPGRFALLLSGLIAVVFPDVFLFQGTFFHRDYSLFSYPLAFHFRESVWRGEWPLWNPYHDCGLPFLAQWNTITLYPASLFFVALPLPWSLGFFCLAHLFWAGWGMHRLAWNWTGSLFAAAVAGTAFAFNSVTLHSLMWPSTIAALGWMPWVVLAVERAWQRGGRSIAIAAVAGAMQMLSGTPEVILLTWGLLALLLAESSLGGSAGVQNSKFKVPSLRLGRFAAVVALVAALSAPQLLPFFELLEHSQRQGVFAGDIWAMPVWGWANFLIPGFGTLRNPAGFHLQPDQLWIFSYYLGIGAFALALLGAWSVRRPRVRLLAGAALLSLVLALGRNGFVYSWLVQLAPPLGFMRFPVKYVLLTTFLVPLLAAFFLAQFHRAAPVTGRSAGRLLTAAFVALGALVGLLIQLAWKFEPSGSPGRFAVTSGLTRLVFLGAVFACLALLCRAGPLRAQRWLCLALVALLPLDVLTSGPRPNPTVSAAVYEPGLAVRESLQGNHPHPGRSRLLHTLDARETLGRSAHTNAFEEVMFFRLGFAGDCNLLDRVPRVGGFFAMYLRPAAHIERILYRDPARIPAGFADFLSVEFVNEPGKALHWQRRPSHLPWLTAGQRPVFADKTRTVTALARDDFDPRQVVYLPPEARDVVKADSRTEARVEVKTFTAHRIEADVEAPQPAMVVISQVHYPAWRAYVDGQPARVWRANYAFQALEVAAGKHRVLVRYEDRGFGGGLVAAFLALGGCAAAILFRRARAD